MTCKCSYQNTTEREKQKDLTTNSCKGVRSTRIHEKKGFSNDGPAGCQAGLASSWHASKRPSKHSSPASTNCPQQRLSPCVIPCCQTAQVTQPRKGKLTKASSCLNFLFSVPVSWSAGQRPSLTTHPVMQTFQDMEASKFHGEFRDSTPYVHSLNETCFHIM